MPFLPEPMRERESQSFATSADLKGFTETLGDRYRSTVAGAKEFFNPATTTFDEAQAKNDRLFTAARRAAFMVDGFGGMAAAREEAYDNRIDAVRRATGVTLENPERNAYYKEAEQEYQNLRRNGTIGARELAAGDSFASRRIDLQQGIFNRKVSELAESNPDKAAQLGFGQSVDDQARAIAQAVHGELELARKGSGGAAGFVTELSGGFAGMARDPLNVAGLALGGGPATATKVAARIGQVALREGAINAGIEAVQQPAVQQWRNHLGLENGLHPALENIGMAFVFGAGIGGGIQGLGEVFGRGARNVLEEDRLAVSNVLRGEASVADVERAAKVMGVSLDDAAKADMKLLRAVEKDEAATLLPVPEGVTRADHGEALGDAIRFAEDPVGAPPPVPPLRDVPDPELRARRPELFTDGEAPSQDQLGLAALSDRAYEMARNGEVDPGFAAWIGRMAPGSPETHAGLARALVDAAPATVDEARLVLRDAMSHADRGVSKSLVLGIDEPGGAMRAKVPVEPGTASASQQADALLPKPAERPVGEAANANPAPPVDLGPKQVGDLIPMATRPDGRDMRAMSVDDALREAGRNDRLGDLIAACKL